MCDRCQSEPVHDHALSGVVVVEGTGSARDAWTAGANGWGTRWYFVRGRGVNVPRPQPPKQHGWLQSDAFDIVACVHVSGAWWMAGEEFEYPHILTRKMCGELMEKPVRKIWISKAFHTITQRFNIFFSHLDFDLILQFNRSLFNGT